VPLRLRLVSAQQGPARLDWRAHRVRGRLGGRRARHQRGAARH